MAAVILLSRELKKRRSKAKKEREERETKAPYGDGDRDGDFKPTAKSPRKLVSSLVGHLSPKHSLSHDKNALDHSLATSPVNTYKSNTTPVIPDVTSGRKAPILTSRSTVELFEMDSGCYVLPTTSTAPAKAEVFEMDGGCCYDLLPTQSQEEGILDEVFELDGGAGWDLAATDHHSDLAQTQSQSYTNSPMAPPPLRLRRREATVRNDEGGARELRTTSLQQYGRVLQPGGIPIPTAGGWRHSDPPTPWTPEVNRRDWLDGIAWDHRQA
jgi:hypothetical protein